MSQAKWDADDTLKHMRSVLLPALVLIVALSGCATAASTPTSAESPAATVPTVTPVETTPTPTAVPTPTETPTETPTAAPATLKSLIAAVKKAGFTCKKFDRDDAVQGTEASGFCSGSQVGISLFADKARVDAVLKLNEDSIEPGAFVVGPNFLISAPETDTADTLKAIRKVTGGELWPTNSPIFD